MSALFAVFRQYLLSGLRDKFTLFWFLVFPVLLLVILVLIFSGMENVEEVQFKVSLLNMEPEPGAGLPVSISRIFTDIMIEQAEQPWLELFYAEDAESGEFLSSELEALSEGQRHAVLVIPEGFDDTIMHTVQAVYTGEEIDSRAEIKLFIRDQDHISGAAGSLFSRMITEMNREIAVESGLIDPGELVTFESSMIEGEEGGFSYPDYIVPGILIMCFLTTGLSTVIEGLLSPREKGILRRYFVTPLSTLQYFGGLMLWVLLISFVQVILVYMTGRFLFGIELELLRPDAIFYMVYSLVVLISCGFFISALAKSADSGSAMANILLYPLMFLGGLFFPIENVPVFIDVFVHINPVTYLANGLREGLGVYPGFTSPMMNLAVPGIWLLISTVISIKMFKWEG